jgi:hypothetical protein
MVQVCSEIKLHDVCINCHENPLIQLVKVITDNIIKNTNFPSFQK